jgi:hypothetical protein
MATTGSIIQDIHSFTRGRERGEKFTSKEIVSFEKLLMSNVIEQEAPVNLLEKKGIIIKAELLGMPSYSSPLFKFLGEMEHFAPDEDKDKYRSTMAFIEKHYRYKIS